MSKPALTQEYTELKILVHPKVMKYFLSTLKLKRKTIEKRTLSHWTDVDDWLKKPTYIEKWKLEILGSLSRYNWAFFLLEPDNLPNKRKSTPKPKTLNKKGK